MADTITVLDGIQFNKDTDDATWTQDAAIDSAVATIPVSIPMEAKTVRVIFNGAYDPNGGRIHTRIKALLVTSISTPTKTAATQPQEWTVLTPPAVVEVTAIDFSASWGGSLAIDMCQSSTTVNTTGVELIVQMLTEDAKDEWVTIHRGVYLAFAAAATTGDWNVGGNTAADTVLLIDNPATAGLDHIGKFIFLEDVNTVAQCEIAFLVSQSGD